MKFKPFGQSSIVQIRIATSNASGGTIIGDFHSYLMTQRTLCSFKGTNPKEMINIFRCILTQSALQRGLYPAEGAIAVSE
jgi:hypothetical protein